MCEICRRMICPSSCPNASEPPIFAECEECGYEIYDGDQYYAIDDKCYCEACVGSFLRTAEVE